MKNHFAVLTKLVAVVACTLTLGSCNRAEYAVLPKGASYHGMTRAVTPVPATAAAQTPPAPTETTAPAPATATPTAEAIESATAYEPAVAPATSKKAAKTPAAISAEEATTVAAPVAMLPQAPQKLTRVQKFAASRLLRTMSKVSGVTQFRQTLNTAKTQKVSGNLRTGIILILIGLLISLFSRVNSVFGLIGAVVAIIGLIFIVLWLLDNI